MRRDYTPNPAKAARDSTGAIEAADPALTANILKAL